MAGLQPVEVYAARDSTEAHFVRNLLADAGIDATVVGEPLRGVLGEVPFQLAGPRLWVHPRDVERARAIVDDYQRRLIERSATERGSEASASENQAAAERFCYHCGQPVEPGQSPCPACGGELEWNGGKESADAT